MSIDIYPIDLEEDREDEAPLCPLCGQPIDILAQAVIGMFGVYGQVCFGLVHKHCAEEEQKPEAS